MGSSLHTSVTIFIRIKDGLVKKDRPYRLETCPNKQCSRHGKYASDKFCSHCGAKIEEIEMMRKAIVSINDIKILEAIGDPFFQPEGVEDIHKTDLFLPYNFNVGNDGFDEEGGVITLEDMHKLKQEYMDHYENHKTASLFFKTLQQEFGEENVTLEFGVISYYW